MYSFIDDDFVSRCLRIALPNLSIRVKNYEVLQKSGKWSGIPTLIVHYVFTNDVDTTGRKSFIIKVPSCTRGYEYRKANNLFTKEQYFYEKILPVMNALYDHPIAPKHLFTAHDQILVFEDLRESGFDVKSSARIDNLEEIVLIIQTLAKFHAFSYKSRDEYLPVIGDKLNEVLLSRASTSNYMHVLIAVLEDVLRQENVSQELISKFSIFIKRVEENTHASLNSVNFDFCTLNHGDLKNDNILIKYNVDGLPIDCRFVDFQTYRWSSPATDLIWIWVTAIDFELFCNHRETMTDVYLESLNRYLTTLDCPIRYTKAEFEQDVLKLTEYWVCTLMWHLRFNVDPRRRDDSTVLPYQRPEFKDAFFSWFDYFQKVGIF